MFYCNPDGSPSTDEPRLGDRIRRVFLANPAQRHPVGTEAIVASITETKPGLIDGPEPSVPEVRIDLDNASIHVPWWPLISRADQS